MKDKVNHADAVLVVYLSQKLVWTILFSEGLSDTL